MKLYYIFHSGFLVETEELMLIFDYYKDTAKTNGIVSGMVQRTDKPIYVFASHIHKDHFTEEIFQWRQGGGEIKYILSGDILDEKGYQSGDVIRLDKGQGYSDGLLAVKAYGSTDEGVSFLVTTGGKTIFHAGDLNNWHWNEEAGPEETAGYEKAFEEELSLIKMEAPHIGLVMFPVDPRLGKDYIKGPRQFIEAIKTDCFAPMHFGSKYEKASAFGVVCKNLGVRFLDIHEKGQLFHI